MSRLSIGLDLNSDLDLSDSRRRRQRKYEQFTPEVEESVMRTLGEKALSGVSAVGNLLDVPGSMVRDVLGGENPFDQLLSPMSDKNRLSGRDLLRKHGFVGQEDTYGNWWGGLAAEIALDPTTYATFGASALTKAGKVARAVGVLDDAVRVAGKGVGKRAAGLSTNLGQLLENATPEVLQAAERAATKAGTTLDALRGEKLRSLVRVGLPFTESGINIGTAESALARGLATGMDILEETALGTAPVRLARALFDPRVGGKVDRAAQKVAEEAYRAKKVAERAARGEHQAIIKELMDVQEEFDNTYGDLIRQDSAQAQSEFANLLKTKGRLNDEEAVAISGIWRSWAEGYLGEDFGTALKKRFAGIDDSGVLNPTVLPKGALAQGAHAPAFYSKLARVVEQKVGGKTTWDQLKATLKNQGVTDEEIADMGLEAFFAGKRSVAKDELLEHLGENAIELEEVLKTAGEQGGGARYFEHQVPGGDPDTYRELLLKTPRNPTRNELFDQASALRDQMHKKYGDGWLRKAPAEEVEKVLEVERRAESMQGMQNYTSIHWDEPNVIAHIRMDDVTAPDGRKFLRIQEIQSDWHQAAKKGDANVPEGPFRESWPKLAVKRALRYAAENGYDGITLVEGKDIAKAVGGPPGPLSDFYDNILAGYIKKYAGKMGSQTGEAVHQELGLRMKTYTLPEKMRAKLLEEGQPLYQANKGAVSFGEDGKAMLHTFKTTDVSTHVHELGHIMRRHLTPDDQEIANKFVGAMGGKWTTEQEETFARGFEKYLRTGQAPSSAIAKVFAKLKEWMTGIYQTITGSAIDVKLSPEIQELYGRLIATPAKPTVKERSVWDTLEKLVEFTTDTGGDFDDAVKTVLGEGAPKASPELEAKVKNIAKRASDSMRTIRDEIESMGGRIGFVESREAEEGLAAFAYGPRYSSGKAAKEFDPLRGGRVLGTQFDSMKKRDAVLRELPKEIINRIATDPEARGKDAAAHIWATYGERLRKDDPLKHAEELAEYFSTKKLVEPFQMRRSEEFLRYMKGASLVKANMEAIHELVKRQIMDGEPGTVLLEAAFKEAGMEPAKALEHLSKLTGKSVSELKASAIPEDMARAIVGVNRVHTQPEWAKAIGEAIDKFNSWFKSNVTVPFPSFWTRNFISGQYMNLASGLVETPSDIAGYGRQVWRVKDMLASKIPDDLLQELITEGVIDPKSLSEGVESVSGHLVSGAPANPLQIGQTLRESRQTVLDNPLFLDRVPGTRTARAGWETVKGTGAKVSANVEFANRVPMYLWLTREKGWSPQAAAAKVAELQVDYADLAPAERMVMKRLIPFYSFNRRIAPVIFTTLLERPGGAMGQTIRASNRAASDDVTLPEQIAGTLSIPNPWDRGEGGSKSYITGFGLPYEAPLAFLGDGFQGAARELLSQTSPPVKGVLEWASGESFFQRGPGGGGRDLDEMDPLIGRTLSNLGESVGVMPEESDAVWLPLPLEFAIANSPASRTLSTTRQMLDPRKSLSDKALNALTGVRVTDVSPRTQDKVLRERATELMEELGAKSFERVFFTEAEKARMDPETLKRVEALELLQAALAQRAKDRKKAESKK